MAELKAEASLTSTGFTTGADKIKSKVDEITRTTESFSTQLSNLGGRLASAFSVAALGAFAMRLTEVAHGIEDVSEATGLTIPQVVALRRLAAENGKDFSAFERILTRVTAALDAAKAGGAKEIETLSSMGMALKDIAGASVADVLMQVGKVMRDSAADGREMKDVYELIGTKIGPEMRGMLISLANDGFGTLDTSIEEHVRKIAEARATWFSFKENFTIDSMQMMGDAIDFLSNLFGDLSGNIDKATSRLADFAREKLRTEEFGEKARRFFGTDMRPEMSAEESAALDKAELRRRQTIERAEAERMRREAAAPSEPTIPAPVASDIGTETTTIEQSKKLRDTSKMTPAERKAAVRARLEGKAEPAIEATTPDKAAEELRRSVLGKEEDKVNEMRRKAVREQRESKALNATEQERNDILVRRAVLIENAVVNQKGDVALYEIEKQTLMDLMRLEEKRLGVVRALSSERAQDLQAQIESQKREQESITGKYVGSEKKRLEIESKILELQREKDKIGVESAKEEEKLRGGLAEIDVKKARVMESVKGEQIPADALTKIGATTYGQINPGFSAASRAEQIQRELLKINQEQLQVMRQLSLGLK